jgi:hypothetical protein
MTSCVHKMCGRLMSHFIHIWYLGWPWSEHAHIIPISRMVDFCESYSPFHVCLTIRPSAHLVYGQTNMKRAITLSQKSNIREIGIICACSDHGQPRYQIWIKCDKRQMTSYVHKMCGRTYGQTNMKRAITLSYLTSLLYPHSQSGGYTGIPLSVRPFVRP